MLGTVTVRHEAACIQVPLRRLARLRHSQKEPALHRLLVNALLEADLEGACAFPVLQPPAKVQ
eukprot:11173062-Alexandrium_andersonii.AAC.1